MIIIDENRFEIVNFVDLDIDSLKMILRWRNDNSVRKWMYNKNPISLSDHLNFVELLKVSKNKLYFLVKRCGVPVGVFSLVDIVNSTGEWGYYLAPEFHGKNLGVEFYYSCLRYCFYSIQMTALIGYALKDNNSANSLNKLFGFEGSLVKKDGYDELFYEFVLKKEKWDSEVVNNKKIKRLLELTK
jgi:UDP-4-amino-4,6-dideoxy-N-acetyl-beta-L-altrosamine N-acetyltransferase